MSVGSTSRSSARIAVIGDVGGHLEELRTELIRLGADAHTGRLPDDLTIIQVGDLVHRGPASDGVIALVDRYLSSQPEQWVQLVGNHEAQYLGDPIFEWPEQISADSVGTLRRWWASGQMVAAAAVVTEGEAFLITHAGLTSGFWAKALAAPRDARQAAAALNSLIGTRDTLLFRAGQMLSRKRPDSAAGPIWAASATELVPGWLQTSLPFSQVHGHTSLFDWQHRRFRTGEEIARRTIVDELAKHETTHLSGGRIIGIDPGHGRDVRRPWQAWEVRTAT